MSRRRTLPRGKAFESLTEDVAAALDDAVVEARQWAGVNAQTGTSYTLVAADAGRIVTMDNDTDPMTLTVPAAEDVAFPVGTQVKLIVLDHDGAGCVVGGTGLTFVGDTTVLAYATLTYLGDDTWHCGV